MIVLLFEPRMVFLSASAYIRRFSEEGILTSVLDGWSEKFKISNTFMAAHKSSQAL